MPYTKPRYCVILNRRAGAQQASHKLAMRIDHHPATQHYDRDYLFCEHPSHLPQHLQQARMANPSGIIVAGGDGTLNTAVNVLRGSHIPLGILPCGTFNYFARYLMLPTADMDQAIDLAFNAPARAIDLPSINDHLFLNNASLGLYAGVLKERERHTAWFGRRRWVAVLSGLLTALRPYHRHRFTIEIEQKPALYQNSALIFCGHNPLQLENYHLHHATQTPHNPLSLFVMPALSRWGMFKLACRIALRRFVEVSWQDLPYYQGKNFVISVKKRRLRVAVDGELWTMRPPIRLNMVTQAAWIRCPQGWLCP